jgi:hypothetical protein
MQHQDEALKRAISGTGTMIDFSGDWTNDLGSVMRLTQKGDLLDGDYKSVVSSDGTQATGALKGYVDGDLIAIIVHWNEFQSITSWVGQCEPNTSNKVIKTLWQMTKQVATGGEWASVNAGSDTFGRI